MMRRFLLFASVSVSALVACSKEETPTSTGDAGFVGREGDNEDPQPVDPGPADPGPEPDAAAPTDSGTCTGKIVINEILTEGGALNKEFIELYNPSTCDVVIEGFKLKYKSASGTPPLGTLLHTFAAGTTIKGKGYYVVGSTQYAGKNDATFSATDNTGNGFLSTSNGQVALFDAAATARSTRQMRRPSKLRRSKAQPRGRRRRCRRRPLRFRGARSRRRSSNPR
jgi:hypothetical protein